MAEVKPGEWDVEKWTAVGRPVLAFMLVGTFCTVLAYMVYQVGAKLSAQDVKEVVVFFAGLVSGLVSYYFGQRGAEKQDAAVIEKINAIANEPPKT